MQSVLVLPPVLPLPSEPSVEATSVAGGDAFLASFAATEAEVDRKRDGEGPTAAPWIVAPVLVLPVVSLPVDGQGEGETEPSMEAPQVLPDQAVAQAGAAGLPLPGSPGLLPVLVGMEAEIPWSGESQPLPMPAGALAPAGVEAGDQALAGPSEPVPGPVAPDLSGGGEDDLAASPARGVAPSPGAEAGATRPESGGERPAGTLGTASRPSAPDPASAEDPSVLPMAEALPARERQPVVARMRPAAAQDPAPRLAPDNPQRPAPADHPLPVEGQEHPAEPDRPPEDEDAAEPVPTDAEPRLPDRAPLPVGAGFWERLLTGLSTPGAEANPRAETTRHGIEPTLAALPDVTAPAPAAPPTAAPAVPAAVPDPSATPDQAAARADDDQALGLPPPPLPSPPGASVPMPGASGPAQLPVPQVASQLAAALSRSADGATELALSPAELGHVRLRLERDAKHPDRVVVLITFERPETMDLFRRHAGELAEALRSAGYAGADIGFGQQHGGGQDRNQDLPRPASEPMFGPAAAETGPISSTAPRLMAGASLDLRL